MSQRKTCNHTIEVGDLVRFLVVQPDKYSPKAYLVKSISKFRLAKLVGFRDNQVFPLDNLKVVS